MKALTPEFARLYEGLRKSASLEKIAAVLPSEEAAAVLIEKMANDSRVFDTAKLAAMGMTSIVDAAKPVMQRVGKGLAYGAGAAIPLAMAGNYVADKATADARNRALETGLGLAGIGATMYGLHRATQPKTAADEGANIEDALKKLASIGYLDELLSGACEDKGVSESSKKLATEVRLLNREYGVEILRNLMG